MSRKWWGVIVASLLGAFGLVLLGLRLFPSDSLWEGTVVEAIGLLAALALAVLLIEGPVLTRQSLTDSLSEYKKEVFLKLWEEVPRAAMAVAEPVAKDLGVASLEAGWRESRWGDLEPTLESVFRGAQDVTEEGIPDVQVLDQVSASTLVAECLKVLREVRRVIDNKPEFEQWYVLGQVETRIVNMENEIRQRSEPQAFEDPLERYRRVGRTGEEMLNLVSDYSSAFDAVSVL